MFIDNFSNVSVLASFNEKGYIIPHKLKINNKKIKITNVKKSYIDCIFTGDESRAVIAFLCSCEENEKQINYTLLFDSELHKWYLIRQNDIKKK